MPGDHATLAAALAAVNAGSRTLVRLLGDSVHETSPDLDLPDTHLAIQADNQRRPFLIGDFALKGNGNTRLSLSGIFLHGALRLSGALRSVDLRHCSLTPELGGIQLKWLETLNFADALRVARHEDTNRVYILTSTASSASIYALDATNGSVLLSQTFASNTGLDLAVSPAGDFIYVALQPSAAMLGG